MTISFAEFVDQLQENARLADLKNKQSLKTKLVEGEASGKSSSFDFDGFVNKNRKINQKKNN